MIDKHREILYNILGVAAVAQSVERRIGSAEVTGPIPVSSFFINKYAKDKSTTNRFIFLRISRKNFIVRKVSFSINV